MAVKKAASNAAAYVALSTMVEAGYFIAPQKGDLVATQVARHLGAMIDSATESFFMPEDKITAPLISRAPSSVTAPRHCIPWSGLRSKWLQTWSTQLRIPTDASLRRWAGKLLDHDDTQVSAAAFPPEHGHRLINEKEVLGILYTCQAILENNLRLITQRYVDAPLDSEVVVKPWRKGEGHNEFPYQRSAERPVLASG